MKSLPGPPKTLSRPRFSPIPSRLSLPGPPETLSQPRPTDCHIMPCPDEDAVARRTTVCEVASGSSDESILAYARRNPSRDLRNSSASGTAAPTGPRPLVGNLDLFDCRRYPRNPGPAPGSSPEPPSAMDHVNHASMMDATADIGYFSAWGCPDSVRRSEIGEIRSGRVCGTPLTSSDEVFFRPHEGRGPRAEGTSYEGRATGPRALVHRGLVESFPAGSNTTTTLPSERPSSCLRMRRSPRAE